MNLDRLTGVVSAQDLPFYRSAATHLAKVLPASLSVLEMHALASVLHLHNIAFVDGFVLSADDQPLGRSDAAILLAALYDQHEHDWQWWRAETSPSMLPTCSPTEFEALMARLIAHMTAHSTVARVE